jgi:NADPH-dependent curcumin reductase CurA
VTTSREIHLAARPHGWPTAETFRLVTVDVPDPGPGRVVIRNQFMSVDPYMRGRMNDGPSYAPPYEVGKVMHGRAVGEVVASDDPALPVGRVVLHEAGWREYAVIDGRHATPVDPAAVPTVSAYLGVLGMPGLTAYVGLLDMAAFQPGDTVFVSGAAGAVGSVVGQIAKARGAARVIGSAGSATKVAHLHQLGFDAAFDYHDGPVMAQLAHAAPDGISVYFDNVGTDHLEAAISSLRPFGRVALCGAISVYNATEPPAAPRNLGMAVGKRLTLRGFIVSDHADRRDAFLTEMGEWIRTGQVQVNETIVDGLEKAPDAFLGMLRGENVGKMVVRI